jgi:Membrane proteins related to metalloendopeptidases
MNPTMMTRRDRPTTRRRRGSLRAAIATVLTLMLVGVAVAPAHADSYPTWQDVQNAKRSASSARAKVAQINQLISNLNAEVARTQAEAKARGEELQLAQQKYFDADRRASQLAAQARQAQQKADAANTQAGRLAAQLYRTGGSDLTTRLLLSGGKSGSQSPDKLLSDLGSMSKLAESTNDIYTQALTAGNTAKALTDQATVAKAERLKLQYAAAAALAAATKAAAAAQDQLHAAQGRIVILRAQADVLTGKVKTITAGYQKGVAKRAAEAAAGNGGAGLPGGYVGPQGWAVPLAGPITDGFGWRVAPCDGCTSFHEGADIGASYGSIIHAAHDGVIEYTGWYGGYGNFILMSNGNGYETAYGHIEDGGILVGIGQRVVAGEAIARVGSTGHSTGPHLHFEVRTGGTPIDPVSFMAQRGAPLG